MRIDFPSSFRGPEFSKDRSDRPKQSSSKPARGDEYTPTGKGTETSTPQVAMLKAFLESIPEIRQDKVADARQKMAAQYYDSKVDDVAENLVGLLG